MDPILRRLTPQHRFLTPKPFLCVLRNNHITPIILSRVDRYYGQGEAVNWALSGSTSTVRGPNDSTTILQIQRHLDPVFSLPCFSPLSTPLSSPVPCLSCVFPSFPFPFRFFLSNAPAAPTYTPTEPDVRLGLTLLEFVDFGSHLFPLVRNSYWPFHRASTSASTPPQEPSSSSTLPTSSSVHANEAVASGSGASLVLTADKELFEKETGQGRPRKRAKAPGKIAIVSGTSRMQGCKEGIPRNCPGVVPGQRSYHTTLTLSWIPYDHHALISTS
jgi:hypothetical protein